MTNSPGQTRHRGRHPSGDRLTTTIPAPGFPRLGSIRRRLQPARVAGWGLALVVSLGLPRAALSADPPANSAADAGPSPLEQRFLLEPRQVTEGLSKAGEGYFSPDGRRIAYQGIPHGYPFYQIYVQAFDPQNPRPAVPTRVSTGRGRTTCAFFTPGGDRLLFASSHLDPSIDRTEREAIARAEEDARTGRRRRYQWDFDPAMELFTAALDGSDLRRLTDRPGYDAECSFSPDGERILFVSDADGDPDVYTMATDGSDTKQLTDAAGYDGGPFYSPDGRWIAYRTDRIEKDLLQIHVMRADGGGDRAVTSGRSVHWAPFWHPTKPWLIWTGADHSDPTRRPNYDLLIARYEQRDGDLHFGPPLRLTDHVGADVLPTFSPDGRTLLWTASRSPDRTSQLWSAGLDLDAIEAALPPVSDEP
jgi:TolB protein